MKFTERIISKVLINDLKSFPVITLTGPRQSGKSTLLKKILSDWKYVNLEEPSNFEYAQSDPKGFIATYNSKVIFDEIQRAPNLLSQIQVEVDNDRKPGRFAVTGSHNLLLLEKVSQSLAGRTAIRNLLPFSYQEINSSKLNIKSIEEELILGGYPSVRQNPENRTHWLDSYVQTYIERDVRMVRAVSDLGMFRSFVKTCAGRAGQLLDLTSIGNDIGISHNTARDWIGVLEAGFVAFKLQPYFKNYSKRIIKSPKLYFYDTGVLCSLLGIKASNELLTHPFRGAIFENWCVLEALKSTLNQGKIPTHYFWKDQSIEVDLLIQSDSNSILAIECKAGKTPLSEFINSAVKLKSIMTEVDVTPAVVYGGDETQNRSSGNFYSWVDFALKAV